MAIPVNGRLTATLYAACMKCKGLRAQQKEIYRVQQRARGSQSKGTRTRGAKESRCSRLKAAKESVDGASNGSSLSGVIGSYCAGREKEVSLDRS
jgi:hypothetical protein